jgi:pyrroloquinoline-quinone synthase
MIFPSSEFTVEECQLLTKCAVCGACFGDGNYNDLSEHFIDNARKSDPGHVMWLNKNITKKKCDAPTLANCLRTYFSLGSEGLKVWMKKRFIERFYGDKPHPFVLALQHPTNSTLLGYVVEHQHFLRQWVRSCAYVVAKTDKVDVTLYELDNISTEFGGLGPGQPSHYELLLRMGESLGLPREQVLGMQALPDTSWAIKTWNEVAERDHWLETMAAMHPLELIANRNLKRDGATIGYFDPSILTGDEVTEATKSFLREGYQADVEHSEEAMELIEKYSTELGLCEDVQATFLKSIDAFDRYLMARLERGKQFESS